MSTTHSSSRSQHACFAALVLLAVAVLYHALTLLISSALTHEAHSQVLLVLPISAMLLYLERREIFASARYSWPSASILLLLAAIFLFLRGRSASFSSEDQLSYSILLFSCWCIAAFLVCYGFSSFRAALFPLLFLILMAPLPEAALADSVTFLQQASADATALLYRATGIPFERTGTIFALPRVTIEIAQECSGIRSSLILVISGLVLAHLFLKTAWSKLVLALLIVPIAIAKNAVRIFALSTLGMYVDQSFLTGPLHHRGGIVFFALGFACLWLAIVLLQKLEKRRRRGNHVSHAEQLARPSTL